MDHELNDGELIQKLMNPSEFASETMAYVASAKEGFKARMLALGFPEEDASAAASRFALQLTASISARVKERAKKLIDEMRSAGKVN